MLWMNVSDNQLSSLKSIPEGLEDLNASNNQLRTLPELPNSLRELRVRGNELDSLERIPALLEMLDVGDNRLETLTPAVMESLRHIETLLVDGNPWSDNALTLFREIRSASLPIASDAIPAINASHDGYAMARPIREAVAQWYPRDLQTQARKAWSVLSDDDINVQAFSAFLDRLRSEKYAEDNIQFCGIVSDWLSKLAQDDALRGLAMCEAFDATQSCEDRVALTWNKMQMHELQQRVAQAPLDTQSALLKHWTREAYVLKLLDEIAATKVEYLQNRSYAFVDEVGVYLAYPTGLAEKLDLHTPVRSMRFRTSSNVTDADLQSAYDTVLDNLNGPQSHLWLNNWVPWQQFIERRFPKEYMQANEERMALFNESEALAKRIAETQRITGSDETRSGQIIAEFQTNKYFAPLTLRFLSPARQDQRMESLPRDI